MTPQPPSSMNLLTFSQTNVSVAVSESKVYKLKPSATAARSGVEGLQTYAHRPINPNSALVTALSTLLSEC